MTEKKRKPVTKRKEEVFLIISQIIAEKGLSEVSTTEVARRLGVSQPAIYKYFKNKDEMIVYFLENLKEQLLEIVKKAKEEKTTKDRLKRIYTEHFRLIERTKILPRVVFSDVIHTGKKEKKEKLREVVNLYKEGIKQIIEEGIKKGEIKDINPEIGARLFIGTIISTALFWMLNNADKSLIGETESLIKEIEKMIFK
ncbi:TetR/AcrR family transcriptional regulator [Persephonella atlantica]|uniref:TetR/AcrR family transcriptional regulator n=1 Tax=Persephonella atlantica TaxID=2699429 RepID=A0ABS1GHU7_9AQUI|nr:TetR/AcrR family transcriptional regulator [Persephonella atlantica]MBK3332450.1 TetR/AcrR family transcriptional regulator [Persephonella atlantica]